MSEINGTADREAGAAQNLDVAPDNEVREGLIAVDSGVNHSEIRNSEIVEIVEEVVSNDAEFD